MNRIITSAGQNNPFGHGNSVPCIIPCNESFPCQSRPVYGTIDRNLRGVVFLMLEFSLYVNVILFVVGVLLIFMLLTKQSEHPVLMRALLLAYFLVVIQYNADRFRFTAEKLMLASATIALFVWVRQPIPATE